MHRDVTSGNVLLTEGAHARIADLGLAQRLNTPDSVILAAAVEADNILMGTYGYVAPEYAMSGAHAPWFLSFLVHATHARLWLCNIYACTLFLWRQQQ